MNELKTVNKVLEKYKGEGVLYEPLLDYFEKNKAARKFGEICEGKKWDYVIDHMAVRTHDVIETAKRYKKLGWKHGEKVDYPLEEWWAEVYRHPKYPTLFIDQSYSNKEQIIKNGWINLVNLSFIMLQH